MYISKVDNFLRLIFLNSLYKNNGSILLTEYPKSGGSWLSNMISQYLEIPFPKRENPPLSKTLIHGHYLPKYNLQNFPKTIVMVRDARDVMVSYYFHILYIHDNQKNIKEHEFYSKRLNIENANDVETNLPKFIEFISTFKPKSFQHFFHPSDWSNFYKEWKKQDDVIFVRYEDLLQDTEQTLKKVLKELGVETIDEEKLKTIVENNSFKKLANRNNNEEDRNSFLRKGIAGDWKNYFSEDAKNISKKLFGDSLIEFGYEENNNW